MAQTVPRTVVGRAAGVRLRRTARGEQNHLRKSNGFQCKIQPGGTLSSTSHRSLKRLLTALQTREICQPWLQGATSPGQVKSQGWGSALRAGVPPKSVPPWTFSSSASLPSLTPAGDAGAQPSWQTPKGFPERKGHTPALVPAASWEQAEAVTDDLSRELVFLHYFLQQKQMGKEK